MSKEAQTRLDLIDPALKAAGWGEVEGSRIRVEVIAPGRLLGNGRRANPLKADYVLLYRGKKLAVIEAKSKDLGVTDGLAQAKDYAERLRVRFTYATNGRGIYEVDMDTGTERMLDGMHAVPTPHELWARTFPNENSWRDLFAAIPFEDRSGSWQPRYYQDNAIEAALDAIAVGKERILLTLATGTGKTAIAFQIAWKLFHSRWNISREPTRRPRILFLADRNILADQAYNSFSAFPDDALVRISPADIRKKGSVPKNASIFFTIFQTFMSGDGETGYFGEYPKDFFDFIVIDECHRGGAKDESSWREILEYFAPATQLGLTATPKRKNNVDTYAYFGQPVYQYSLKEGINDGFLTPFRVRQIATTIDDYTYTDDDEVLEGEVEEGKRYTETDFNKSDGIVIEARERKRVQIFMDEINQREKTLVFCKGQPHAAMVRDLINQVKDSKDVNYCVRVGADDGERGEQFLRTFQDNEKTIPTILTTSTKLSTGVDARNVRNIVLLRRVASMIEFKQIVGRGTRLFDGKDYFTIYDFARNYEMFEDPEWDGEPIEPVDKPATPRPGSVKEDPEPYGDDDDDGDDGDEAEERRPTLIRLSDGKVRQIQHMAVTTFWGPDGKPLSAKQFIEKLFGELPELFKDEDELRTLWGQPETRKALLNELSERGYGSVELKNISRIIDAENSDLFDVLAYIAYAKPTITRQDRADRRRDRILGAYDDKQREFLEFVLAQYVREGVTELEQEKLKDLLELKYHTVSEAVAVLGSTSSVREAFLGCQRRLYEG